MSHTALKVLDRLTADERHNAARPESEDRVRCRILASQLALGHSGALWPRQEPALEGSRVP